MNENARGRQATHARGRGAESFGKSSTCCLLQSEAPCRPRLSASKRRLSPLKRAWCWQKCSFVWPFTMYVLWDGQGMGCAAWAHRRSAGSAPIAAVIRKPFSRMQAGQLLAWALS